MVKIAELEYFAQEFYEQQSTSYTKERVSLKLQFILTLKLYEPYLHIKRRLLRVQQL
jgi:hypothetical protein